MITAASSVDEIRALRDSIKKERAHLLELSSAIAALDAMLRESAKGHSLQPLYAKVPDIFGAMWNSSMI